MAAEALEAMANAPWANPASSHAFGAEAALALAEAQQKLAAVIGADPREVVFTSGATEANNLAIKGAAQFYTKRGKHILTVVTEHKAVLDAYEWLAGQGYDVTYLSVKSNGLVDLQELTLALRPDTILVSVMHVNNETGVRQPLDELSTIVRQHGAKLHVDAAQSFAKLPLSWNDLAIDYLSVSAHKCYGPKGIGALFVRRQPRARLIEQIHGGGQQQNVRSGTVPVALCAGFAAAATVSVAEQHTVLTKIAALKAQLIQGLQALGGVVLHGPDDAVSEHSSPYIANIGFEDVNGESLLLAIPDLAVSTGSACASAHAEPSKVLRAMGASTALAEASLRFGFGRDTSTVDIDQAIQSVTSAVVKLRHLAAIDSHDEIKCDAEAQVENIAQNKTAVESMSELASELASVSAAASVSGLQKYSREVLRRFYSPQYYKLVQDYVAQGSPNETTNKLVCVLEREASDPAYGDVVTLFLYKVAGGPETGKVEEGKTEESEANQQVDHNGYWCFACNGSPTSIAVMDWVCEQLNGGTIDVLTSGVKALDIIEKLNLQPEQHYSAVLAANLLADTLSAYSDKG